MENVFCKLFIGFRQPHWFLPRISAGLGSLPLVLVIQSFRPCRIKVSLATSWPCRIFPWCFCVFLLLFEPISQWGRISSVLDWLFSVCWWGRFQDLVWGLLMVCISDVSGTSLANSAIWWFGFASPWCGVWLW